MISLSRAIQGFESYLADERRFSPRTVLAYRADLDRFTGFWETEFGETPAARAPLSKVDTLAVRSYLAHLHRDRLANRSLARHLSTLRSFFRWACREGHLEKSPALGLPTPRLPKTLPRAMTLRTPSGSSRPTRRGSCPNASARSSSFSTPRACVSRRPPDWIWRTWIFPGVSCG